MYKLFIIAGVVLLLIGIIGAIFGKLPGDFRFSKGNITVYFPLMTSIIISIVLSLIIFVLNKFR